MDKTKIRQIKWELENLINYYLKDENYSKDDARALANDVSRLITYLEYEEENEDE